MTKAYSLDKQLPFSASSSIRFFITALLVLIVFSKSSAQLVVTPRSKYQLPAVDSAIENKTGVLMPMCKPPHVHGPRTTAPPRQAIVALSDTTPPSPPESLQVVRESIHSVFAQWKAASDPESGIDYYAFAFGTAPGETDVEWWQSTGLELVSYSKSMNALGRNEGDTVYLSVRATNTAGLSSEIVSSGPIVFEYEPLGVDSNDISIDFSSDWSQDELDDLQWFLSRMLPIIKEIYGPPSHSYAVTLVKDSAYSSSAIFLPSSNEIHMDGLYPQLLTHEIIHAFRDNVILSSDDNWNYDPTLSGFEESFAQGISYVCMNRYVELYPADPVVPGNTIYGSTYDWDYDYHNTAILTTTDFWSDASGTGIFWLRYEIGAAAIIKILKNYPNFSYDFNREYYTRINADHALTTSRELMRQIISGVAPLIEGRESNEWIDRQHIFDCFVRPGRKIWVRTQHYPDWDEYLVFQTVYYYETFSNGSEWAYWDDVNKTWVYHSLNGSAGYGVLRNWNGDIVWEKDLLIEPIENPPDYFGFGSEIINLSTDSDTSPWPGGDSADYILNLTDFGLYRLALSFGNDSSEVIRILGDSLRNTTGVFGAVLSTTNGTIYLNHEDFPEEPPIPVVDGVFKGERGWTSIPNLSTGYKDSQPGRVLVTYRDENGYVFEDERNIDLGSWSGNQLFLFDTQAMSVVQLPSQVSLISPSDIEVIGADSVQFVWRQSGAAVSRYWFELATDSVMTNPVVDSTLTSLDTTKTVRELFSNQTYWWRVRARSPAGWGPFSEKRTFRTLVTSVEGDGDLPREFHLGENYPNPFNPATKIRYELPKRARVALKIYDLLGREVAVLVDEEGQPGRYEVTWQPTRISSGIYVYRLEARDAAQGSGRWFMETKKLILMK